MHSIDILWTNIETIGIAHTEPNNVVVTTTLNSGNAWSFIAERLEANEIAEEHTKYMLIRDARHINTAAAWYNWHTIHPRKVEYMPR